LDEIDDILGQAVRLGTVETVYFEGGEPFLERATLIEGVRRSSRLGFQVGIVSNGYWGTSRTAARARLRPLVEAGLNTLALSTDALHGGAVAKRRMEHAAAAAQEAGLALLRLSVEPPQPGRPYPSGAGGTIMFRGRAAVRLAGQVPHHPWDSFTVCPYENLADPRRVHVDPFGYVHLCQGLVMGNLFEQPLAALVAAYEPAQHPIAGPLLEAGPAGLARRYALACDAGYADACHLCYSLRNHLRSRFPVFLAPAQMYGQAMDAAATPDATRGRGAV
jgi:MoaA/NifB/PqqE/SkfB family radical SAM enzyme